MSTDSKTHSQQPLDVLATKLKRAMQEQPCPSHHRQRIECNEHDYHQRRH
jgi:hypothetical protein